MYVCIGTQSAVLTTIRENENIYDEEKVMKKLVFIVTLLFCVNVNAQQTSECNCKELTNFTNAVGTVAGRIVLAAGAGTLAVGGIFYFRSIKGAESLLSKIAYGTAGTVSLAGAVSFILLPLEAGAASLDAMYAKNPELLLDLNPKDACKWIHFYPNTVGKSVANATEYLNEKAASKIATETAIKEMRPLVAQADNTSIRQNAQNLK